MLVVEGIVPIGCKRTFRAQIGGAAQVVGTNFEGAPKQARPRLLMFQASRVPKETPECLSAATIIIRVAVFSVTPALIKADQPALELPCVPCIRLSCQKCIKQICLFAFQMRLPFTASFRILDKLALLCLALYAV